MAPAGAGFVCQIPAPEQRQCGEGYDIIAAGGQVTAEAVTDNSRRRVSGGSCLPHGGTGLKGGSQGYGGTKERTCAAEQAEGPAAADSGSGKNIAQDLRELGIFSVADLKGKDPQELYRLDCLKKDFRRIRASCMYFAARCILRIKRIPILRS